MSLLLQAHINYKRGVVAFLAAFVVIFVFEFLWRGMLMKNAYMETAVLWRTDTDLSTKSLGIWLAGGLFEFALVRALVGAIYAADGSLGPRP